ncbi:MAG: nanT [Ramlibacter sp.]|uniref:MFS transporter n=1 Tax=Ramlibacter sp. TaxID=1917967 RepID=UPI002602BC05|nr:MFS transporter [Ramlibacter sp.]MDB5751992.1 nanT [Ramlibacter sp.]
MKIFYGWRVAAAGSAIHFLHSALLLQAFGAYVAVLSQERGWSKTALAGGAALQSIEGAVLGPALGWMVDRFGPRIMVQVGIVLLSLGFLSLSQIDSLGGFYATMVLIALGASLSGYFPLSVALVHWFKRWRARALSLMSLGLAAGGIAAPLVGWAMQSYGWRNVALASAVITLCVGFPLARIVRSKPSEIGETVDGDPVPPPLQAGAAAPPPGREFSAAQALRTRAFWLLGLGHGLALLVVAAVNVHAISHIKEGLGYSLAQAALVITVMTIAQAGGVLLGALMGDRWNKRYVAAGCMLAHMLGLLALTYANHVWMLGAFAILHGTAWGLRGPFMQALRADYFGLRAIGMILGLSAVIIALGQIAGPLIAGVFADLTGNYRSGFTILALIAGSGSVLFMLARKPE